jgi:hypothetical protein
MAVSCKPYLKAVAASEDQKSTILSWVGDLSGNQLVGDRVLVATYARPEKIGSIIMPDSIQQEDEYQGCIGLLLACGPSAFVYDGAYRLLEPDPLETKEEYEERRLKNVPQPGDWVAYRPADGHSITIGQAACRIFKSECIEMKVHDPVRFY